MKKLLLTSCLALSIASGLSAGILVSKEIGGAAIGANLINFDDFDLGQDSKTVGPVGDQVTVSFAGGPVTGAKVVSGESAGVFAPPFVSGLNGLGFDNPAGDHADNTHYLTTGLASITFDFEKNQNYFGLLWGSVDNFNSLEFWLDGVHVVTVTGTNVWAAANGDQGLNGTFYVNLLAESGTEYNQVIAKSDNYAFEIDNVAYGLLSVPDSGATVALLGLSLACLVFFRRKL